MQGSKVGKLQGRYPEEELASIQYNISVILKNVEQKFACSQNKKYFVRIVY